jgi:hypothetical protein
VPRGGGGGHTWPHTHGMRPCLYSTRDEATDDTVSMSVAGRVLVAGAARHLDGRGGAAELLTARRRRAVVQPPPWIRLVEHRARAGPCAVVGNPTAVARHICADMGRPGRRSATDSRHSESATDSRHSESATDSRHSESATDSRHSESATDSRHSESATDSRHSESATDSRHSESATDSRHSESATDSRRLDHPARPRL